MWTTTQVIFLLAAGLCMEAASKKPRHADDRSVHVRPERVAASPALSTFLNELEESKGELKWISDFLGNADKAMQNSEVIRHEKAIRSRRTHDEKVGAVSRVKSDPNADTSGQDSGGKDTEGLHQPASDGATGSKRPKNVRGRQDHLSRKHQGRAQRRKGAKILDRRNRVKAKAELERPRGSYPQDKALMVKESRTPNVRDQKESGSRLPGREVDAQQTSLMTMVGDAGLSLSPEAARDDAGIIRVKRRNRDDGQAEVGRVEGDLTGSEKKTSGVPESFGEGEMRISGDPSGTRNDDRADLNVGELRAGRGKVPGSLNHFQKLVRKLSRSQEMKSSISASKQKKHDYPANS